MAEMKPEPRMGILSVRGPKDEIGIGASITGFLASRGANIREERVQVLSVNYFLETLVFEADEQQMRLIRNQAKDELEGPSECLRDVDVVVLDGPPPAPERDIVLYYVLDVTAADEPCIAATLEGALRDRGINIIEVRGGIEAGAASGRDIYVGRYWLAFGNSRSVRMLQEDLKTLENVKGWELVLQRETEGPRPSLGPRHRRDRDSISTTGVPVEVSAHLGDGPSQLAAPRRRPPLHRTDSHVGSDGDWRDGDDGGGDDGDGDDGTDAGRFADGPPCAPGAARWEPPGTSDQN